MGMSDHGTTSAADVVVTANIARAAYKNEPLPGGWTALDGTVLKPTQGSFEGIYFNSDPSAPGGIRYRAQKRRSAGYLVQGN